MAHTAAHRAPTTVSALTSTAWKMLSPGQQLTARITTALAAMWTIAFLCGRAGVNPVAGAVQAIDVIWTVSTSPVTVALAVGAVGVAMYLRTILTSNGAHRA